jgi:hypothetical protein
VFVQRPISAVFVGLCVLLIGSQIYVRMRGGKPPIEPSLHTHDKDAPPVSAELPTAAE